MSYDPNDPNGDVQTAIGCAFLGAVGVIALIVVAIVNGIHAMAH